MAEDRYEPLPPLTRLPAFLWRRMSRGARLAAIVLAVGAAVAAVLLAPGIRESKREDAARERREEAASRARRIRELRALQRPRSARTDARGREALIRAISRAVAADAHARTGERILRTDCRVLEGTRFSCTAITSFVRLGGRVRGVVGYPYRARSDGARGTITWCRIAGRPGEGSLSRTHVAIPAVCGG